MSALFLLVFVSVKESTCETRNKNYISKALFVLEKIKFNLQVSRRHYILKNKTRNTFHWRTWRVTTVCWWNLVSLKKQLSKNFIKEFHKNSSLKTSSIPFCICKELSTNSIKLLVRPVSVKIQFFQNTLNDICRTLWTTYDQNFSPMPWCLQKLLPQNPRKNGPNWVLNKESSCLFRALVCAAPLYLLVKWQ